MLNHVKNITTNLSKKTNLKKNDLVLDIASNDGSLLNFYKDGVIKFGIDPILKKYKDNYKNIKYSSSSFFFQPKKLKPKQKKNLK